MAVCAACGTENPVQAKFCLESAAPLAVPAPSREQRKTVTVLFCDVAGSTALGESTDPVVEVIKQLDALPSDPAARAAIRSLLGETSGGTSAEEIAWAFRKLLEQMAPLVVVFDDVQWRRRRSSIFSSTSQCFPRGRRSCFSVWHGRSSASAAPSGP